MHRSTRHSIPLPGIEAISIVSDRTFPRHSHDDFGIGVMVNGGHESWSGRGLVEANAGDVITVNPGELHDGIGRADQPRHWRMLFLSPESIAEMLDIRAVSSEIVHPVLRGVDTCTRVAQAVAVATCDHPDSNQIEEALLEAVHSLFGHHDAANDRHKPAISPAIARVVARIEAEADRPLTLADYADTAGLSRFQILRRFAQEVGATPHAYLVQHRVKLARRVITAGLPLAEAAIASGFSDQSHMTRAFNRQFGLSPGRYRTI